MITPVHWAAALFIASVLHVTAIAWLHQPHARVDPADVDSGIVISLQPAAARQRSSLDALGEPTETRSDVRNTPVQQAADATATEMQDVAPSESRTVPSAEPAPVSSDETLAAATPAQPAAQRPVPVTPAAPPAVPPGPVPAAPASVDVAAAGTESVAPAVAQAPPTSPPALIAAPETAASVAVAEIRDVPLAELAPPAAHTVSPGVAAALPSLAVQPLTADSPVSESAPDAAEAGDPPSPALREPVSISTAVATPVAPPPREHEAAQDLPPAADLRGRTVVLDLESVQAAPAAQSAVAPAEAITPTQALTPAEVVTARAVPATPLQARAKQDLAGVTAQYAGLLKGWLKRHMHYPRQAWLDGTQGTAVIRFSIDRRGSVLNARLERSSGHQILDDEVLQMVRRADPFPAIPPDILGQELAIRVPVRFHIADYGRTRHVPPIELK